ncbi:hypothetical protein MCOR27_010320 [Pyricularia oryzae]|uniref:Nicotinamide-nucleotide adenylyltransferase n=1 Tax=Pyricularia grisea TaxID=148305 RepID=A0ABQ8N7Z6_PYRGI|nr:hypothetical protein MCOR01_010546 [Pyricularia oryzae]KAI6291469.1 hypothetical protein MCOR33_010595 [Pyricularia grisea]KAH9438460.1 hypothetical protein MCOR02_002083 [Pyricularia oryzae]KAI6262102.1 hypothetical protein MCOR19_001619 [Pyricularia oryzae]KAI6268079.1 hypothetical protein MCOR27_010320 [Pyricularia oryzae]
MAATMSNATSPTPQFPPTTPGYTFPVDKLRTRQTQNERTPLVLVACGSFSPITYLHLRMFEMARDHCSLNTNFEVVGGYISPVSDAYKKAGLAPAHHRINMCKLSLASSSWIMVDEYETSVRNPTTNEPAYTPTAQVLAKLDHEINTVLGGIQSADDPNKRTRARICLLAGGDLVLTMSTPGLWAPSDLDVILGPKFGAFIVERSGTDTEEALASLQRYRDNIWVIPQVIQNDVSSTKIRLFLKKNLSIRYLIPDPVVRYIEEHGLFNGEFSGASSSKEAEPSPSTA